MHTPEIKVLPTPAALAEEGARRVVEAAAAAIDLTGTFSIILSGGSTPRNMYELLAGDRFRDLVDWPKVHVFFGDERCVPPDHPDSNYRMAAESLLRRVPIPGDNVYRMRGEIDPNAAAIEYGRMLQERFGEGGADLTLLGMGADGHTASLFPQTGALNETRHRCLAQFVPQIGSWRITLTAGFINRSGAVMVLVAGADKALRLQEVLEGPRDAQRLPIQLIGPASGRMTWLLDAAAAGMQE